METGLRVTSKGGSQRDNDDRPVVALLAFDLAADIGIISVKI